MAIALDRLEQGVLNDAVSLSSLLRQVLVMGGRASSEPLRNWASRELKGYGSDDVEAPRYRNISAQLKADITAGPQQFVQDVRPQDLPPVVRDVLKDEVSVPWGVAEIRAAVSRSDRTHLCVAVPGMADVARALTRGAHDPFVAVTSVYWSVSMAALEGVLDQVRTQLAVFVAELRATMPEGEHEPTSDQIKAAASVVSIKVGDNSPVTVTAPVAYAGQDATATIQAPRGRLSQR